MLGAMLTLFAVFLAVAGEKLHAMSLLLASIFLLALDLGEE